MQQGTAPLNRIAAALVTQLFILLIICLGALILRFGEPPYSRYHERPGLTTASFAWTTLLLAIASMGALLFSEEYASTYQPLFGHLILPTMLSTNALAIMFVSDIIALGFLISLTGGSRASAFSPILFSLPSFAIFLREPLGRIVVYAALITILFTLQMFAFKAVYKGEYQDRPESQRADAFAFWAVAFATLVLTTAIGYGTRLH